MDTYGEECWRPILFVDWKQVAAGVEVQYVALGLLVGYLGAIATVLLVLGVMRLIEEYR